MTLEAQTLTACLMSAEHTADEAAYTTCNDTHIQIDVTKTPEVRNGHTYYALRYRVTVQCGDLRDSAEAMGATMAFLFHIKDMLLRCGIDADTAIWHAGLHPDMQQVS